MKLDAIFEKENRKKTKRPKKMEEWIKANKKRFKEQYGEDWEQVLYATANKLFK